MSAPAPASTSSDPTPEPAAAATMSLTRQRPRSFIARAFSYFKSHSGLPRRASTSQLSRSSSTAASSTCSSTMSATTFDATDALAINTIRCLAADMVQKANSGHPGAPMGCAPMAHTLFSRFIRCNPRNPKWINRDRFVLSNGHGCALQYVMLHLLGYDLSMDDLKAFRQLGSKTPGHPEAGHTPGIELTTGPLGQGISSAVGLAIAEAHMAATFNRPGFELFDNYTYVILGDGCLQEGVASEAMSLAGHLQLGKLIALYDDNHIQIDGDTELGFTEDVCKRMESYGWHTLVVSDGDSTNPIAIAQAVEAAKKVTDKPTLIKVRTTIGFGSAKAGQEKVHGSPLGAADLAHAKKTLGLNPDETFQVPQSVRDLFAKITARGVAAEEAWNALFKQYQQAHPELAAELARRQKGELPSGLKERLPKYTPADAPVATRKLSENLLNAVAEHLPELMGGSADLTGSNLTRWKTATDFQPPATKLGDYSGRYLRFGVREHGMAAICNGLSAYGGFIPFCATFLVFAQYAAGATRLSSLSHHQVLYVMTHDSIGLGEDGPTHQPIETLAVLRATPNTLVFRPADGNEVSGAYWAALTASHTPSVFALSRQNVPHLEGSSADGVTRGGYVLSEAKDAQITLVGTGTELSLAVDAAKKLREQGIVARVVSLPCWQLFDAQPRAYQDEVFPAGIPVVSVEALGVFGWERYAHASVGLHGFGASGPAPQVYKQFGITVEGLVEKAQATLKYFAGKPVPNKLDRI
ncbi:Transketolase [Allomyces javanicus]|nr:Transketolase [Allomyces javanicus]